MNKALFTVSLLFSVLVACSSDKATAPIPTNGLYALVSINGTALPYSTTSHDTTASILADTLAINTTSGTYADSTTARLTVAGTVVGTALQASAGTIASVSNTFQLTDGADGTQLNGTIGNGTATLTNTNGAIFVYRHL